MAAANTYLKVLHASAKKLLHAVSEIWDRLLWGLIIFLMMLGFVWYCLRYTIPEEMALRQSVAAAAEKYLNVKEADGSHQMIIDRYNSQDSLPRGYSVTYEDSWCAVFGSVLAMELELTDLIPLECSCEQQIKLFSEKGNWIETDWYLPKPGDYIYYDWNYATKKDSKGWSDHVGVVVKTTGPIIQVIEGNKDDAVSFRYIFCNDPTIRGYGIPDYGRICFESK